MNRNTSGAVLAAILTTVVQAAPQDTERATHGDEATTPQLSATSELVSTPGHELGAFEVPEPIEPTLLAALLLDQPQNYAIVDVRPGWQYREYHVPGAVNVEPASVLAHVKALPKSARVVLVDRDGTSAWAVAGAVSAVLPEARALRVLAGGTARFWRDVEIAVQAPPAAHGAQTVPANAPAPSAKPAAKKRSAGC